ncbi:MAG: type II toxin-antitoxin system PemK/MazF family toxin [Chroococcidiopsidaceae cyanobacterium CP_BM_RX_35]|nr:type II toxin-antitoxin system PemK/MazF family toxin [Chroococcidiopsidaceae cyanobacterium CP_BM_RX_35]
MIIVSREAINAFSEIVIGVPRTTYRAGRRIYPSQIMIPAPDGGLDKDSVAMAEQLKARYYKWQPTFLPAPGSVPLV